MEMLTTVDFTGRMHLTWSHAVRPLTGTAALGAALSGGVFLAFSTFVMPGLRRLPDAVGVQAMQSVNRAAPASPVFMLTLFGTAGLTAVLAVDAVVRRSEQAAMLRLGGSLAFLVAIVLTAAYHVPRNDALALLDPTAAATAARWRTYAAGWTRWNHLRALASVAGAVLLGAAALDGRP